MIRISFVFGRTRALGLFVGAFFLLLLGTVDPSYAQFDPRSLVGMSRTNAELELAIQGVAHEIERSPVCGGSDEKKIGVVHAIRSRSDGTGQIVTIVVAEAGIELPNVIFLSAGDAKGALGRAGLNLVTVSGTGGPVAKVDGATPGDCLSPSRVVKLVLRGTRSNADVVDCPESQTARLFFRSDSSHLQWVNVDDPNYARNALPVKDFRDRDLVFVGGDEAISYPFVFAILANPNRHYETELVVLCKANLKIISNTREPVDSAGYPVSTLIGEAVAWQISSDKILVWNLVDDKWTVTSNAFPITASILFLSEKDLALVFADSVGNGYVKSLGSKEAPRQILRLPAGGPVRAFHQMDNDLFAVRDSDILRVDITSGALEPVRYDDGGAVLFSTRFAAPNGQGLFIVQKGNEERPGPRATILTKNNDDQEQLIENIDLSPLPFPGALVDARFFVEPKDANMEDFDVVATVNGPSIGKIICFEIGPAFGRGGHESVPVGVIDFAEQIDFSNLRPLASDTPRYIAYNADDSLTVQTVSSIESQGCWSQK